MTEAGGGEAPAWVAEQHRMNQCFWLLRSRRGMAWPDEGTNLMFLAAALGGELAELKEAAADAALAAATGRGNPPRPLARREACMEAADAAIYCGLLAAAMGCAGAAFRAARGIGEGREPGPAAAAAALGAVLNRVKKQFRDGGHLPDCAEFCAPRIGEILAHAGAVSRDHGMPLDEAVAEKVRHLRGREHFAEAFALADDNELWPDSRLAAARWAALAPRRAPGPPAPSAHDPAGVGRAMAEAQARMGWNDSSCLAVLMRVVIRLGQEGCLGESGPRDVAEAIRLEADEEEDEAAIVRGLQAGD